MGNETRRGGIQEKEISLVKLAHVHDERLPVVFIQSGLPVLWRVVRELCG